MGETEDETSIHRSIAAFVAWLSRQRTPADVRRIYPAEVDRFLHWRHRQWQAGADCTADTYLTELAPDLPAQDRDVIADAISHYRQFLTHEAEPPPRDPPP